MRKEDVKKCPLCKLDNLPYAKRCDCGYIFTTREKDEHKLESYNKVRRKEGSSLIIWGIICIMLSPILTFASYKLSEFLKSSRYFVFAGLVIFGIILIFRGIKLRIYDRP